jgi:hypothetical protein
MDAVCGEISGGSGYGITLILASGNARCSESQISTPLQLAREMP